MSHGSKRIKRASSRNENHLRVGVWGPVGNGNMGNEMSMAAAIQNLRRTVPSIEIYGFSLNPVDTAQRHGVPALPIRRGTYAVAGREDADEGEVNTPSGLGDRLKRHAALFRLLKAALRPIMEFVFLLQTFRRLRDLDLLLFTGTGILTDSWGGPAGFPLRLLVWTSLSTLAKTRYAFVSVGAGPIDSWASRVILRRVLRGALYRSFRDPYSRDLIERIGVAEPNRVYPDLAFSLDVESIALSSADPRRVVVACLPYRKPECWEDPSSDAYGVYLENIARFAAWLTDEGYTVHLVPNQVQFDPVFIQDLHAFVCEKLPKTDTSRIVPEPVGTFDGLMRQFSQSSIIVTSRFHGIVFGYLVGRPVLALSYHPKMDEIMKSFGQHRFCLDISTVDSEALRRAFRELEADRHRISELIVQRVQDRRVLIDKQYRELLSTCADVVDRVKNSRGSSASAE